MEKRTIGECFYQIRNGANIKQGVVDGGIPITRIETIANDQFNRDRMGYAGITDARKYESYILEDGDLLMSHINSVRYLGRTVLYRKQGDEKIIHGMNLLGLKADRKIIDPAYARLYFCSTCFREQIGRITKKSVNQASFSVADLKKLTVPAPPLSEQLEQVCLLDKISHLIFLRQKELQMYDDLIKSRFIELFGHPVANEMGWKKVPLSVCVKSIDNGKSFVCDTEPRHQDWPAVLKLSAATYGYYRPEENKALLDANQFVGNATVHTGDLLFTRKNTPELVGMCAYVYDTPKGLMMPDLIFRLNTTDECNKIFLWKLINHDLFRDCIQAIATGSAKSMSNISKERLLNLEVILPPLELQKQFAVFVEQTDKSKVVVQKALDEAQTLFDSLMQEYFG